MGGPALQAEGLETLVNAADLLSMGFSEILSRLPRIWRALNTLEEAARLRGPMAALVVDYPDFHFRLARRLQKLGIPVVDFIPPKVWVWRKSRVMRMKQVFSKVLCIFPFEEKFYEGSGVPAVYVGNPLMDELPFKLTREDARTRLKIAADDRAVVLLPGSRESELKIHIPLMLDAAEKCAEMLRLRLKVLVPLPDAIDQQPWLDSVLAQVDHYDHLDVKFSFGDAHLCMIAADAGLIKSGTSTLEAALLGCPHAVVYKTGKLTEWIFKYLIRYRGPVGLVNLALGWREGEPYRATEWICDQATVENLKQELVTLLSDESYRAQLKKSFLPILLGLSGRRASESAAREVLQLVTL